ncbi:MAG: hypothetical protein A4E23_01510 [Methanomethylovorans sp. PtaU1.Bin073]|jgi:hypothetical protein|nr:MAG: hypothetical protein A4E23_01510 [Methanomethylovorans sp. PtaU1.Bin073]
MNTLLAFLIAIILFAVSVAITAVALKYAISIQNPTSNPDTAVNQNLETDFLLEDNKKEEIQ